MLGYAPAYTVVQGLEVAMPWYGTHAQQYTLKPIRFIVKKLEDLGITIVANQPDEFYAFVVREHERWKNLIANRKITVD